VSYHWTKRECQTGDKLSTVAASRQNLVYSIPKDRQSGVVVERISFGTPDRICERRVVRVQVIERLLAGSYRHHLHSAAMGTCSNDPTVLIAPVEHSSTMVGMTNHSDPVGISLEISETRVREAGNLSAAGAASIILSEIELYVRVGDPVAQAIAVAVTQTADLKAATSATAATVLSAARDTYTTMTDPDTIPAGLSAF
jgi:hypothetical protein